MFHRASFSVRVLVMLLGSAAGIFADIPPSGRRINVTARLVNASEFPGYTFIVRSSGRFGISYTEVRPDAALEGAPRSARCNLLAVKTSVLNSPAHSELVAFMKNGSSSSPQDALMKLTEGKADFVVSDDPVAWEPQYTEDPSNEVKSITREYRIAGFEGQKLRVYLARETRVGPGDVAEVKELPDPMGPGASPSPAAR